MLRQPKGSLNDCRICNGNDRPSGRESPICSLQKLHIDIRIILVSRIAVSSFGARKVTEPTCKGRERSGPAEINQFERTGCRRKENFGFPESNNRLYVRMKRKRELLTKKRHASGIRKDFRWQSRKKGKKARQTVSNDRLHGADILQKMRAKRSCLQETRTPGWKHEGNSDCDPERVNMKLPESRKPQSRTTRWEFLQRKTRVTA